MLPRIQRRGKKGLFSMRYWVPERFRSVEPRKEFFVALKTDDEGEAMRVAMDVQKRIEAELSAKLAGSTPQNGGAEYYERVRDLALANGFRFKESNQLGDAELVQRLLTLKQMDSAGQNKELQDAALGTVERPKLMMSELFDEFERLNPDKVKGMTPDGLRRWRNPRMKAVRNFIEVCGDKPILEVTRDDALDFRGWWQERLDDPEDPANSANSVNKDLTHLNGMLNSLCDLKRWSNTKPFAGMGLKEKGGRTIQPFNNKWILENLMCDEPLPRLNEEARDVLLAMVNTGCRPSELTGLMPEDIHLDAPIPFIDINRKHRTLKTDASVRQIPLYGVSLEAMKRNPDGFPSYRFKDLWSSTVNKFLRENNVLPSPDHRAYSLRHSFEDRMTQAEIPERTAADMMGHTLRRERYGRGPTLKKKLEVIIRIEAKPDEEGEAD